MVMITDINRAIRMIDPVPAPAMMIIIGPNETFGRLFRTVRYGSSILARNLNLHSSVAINSPIIVPRVKLTITS